MHHKITVISQHVKTVDVYGRTRLTTRGASLARCFRKGSSEDIPASVQRIYFSGSSDKRLRENTCQPLNYVSQLMELHIYTLSVLCNYFSEWCCNILKYAVRCFRFLTSFKSICEWWKFKMISRTTCVTNEINVGTFG